MVVMVVVLVYTVLDGFLTGVSFPYIFGVLARKSIFWYFIGHFQLFQLVLSLKVSGELLGLHAGGLFGYGGSLGGVRIIAKETFENGGSRVAILYCIGWVPCWSFLPIYFLDFWLKRAFFGTLLVNSIQGPTPQLSSLWFWVLKKLTFGWVPFFRKFPPHFLYFMKLPSLWFSSEDILTSFF